MQRGRKDNRFLPFLFLFVASSAFSAVLPGFDPVE